MKKDLPTDLPKTEHTFQIDIQGEITRKRFLGEFRCKIPTLKDQSMIGRHEAMLNGEYSPYLDPGVKKLNKWMSYLKFTLTDYPIFWRESDLGYELRDPNVVEEVYNQVLRYEEAWLEEIWGKADESNETEDEKES